MLLLVAGDPSAYAFQPENTLKLKPWKNDPHDTTLLDLLPFLQMIATRGVKDTRDVVKSYNNEDDVAKAFKERMAHLAEKNKASGRGRGLFGVAAH